MSALYEAFEAVRKLAESAQGVYSRVDVGALPASDGLCMALSAGGETSTALDLSGDLSLDVVANAKHKYQTDALNALADVHHSLTRKKDLPRGKGWQVLSIATSSAPTYIEYDGDQYLYGSGLDVRVYLE